MTDIKQLIDRITQSRNQGVSNPQIIHDLEKEGYSQTDIFDAMNQKQLGGNTMPNQNQNPGMPPMPGAPPGPPANDMNTQQIDPMNSMNSMDPGMMGSTNEELIETIIEEKWNEIIKQINKIITWKNRTEEKVVRLEEQFKSLKDQFDELHRAVIGKIGEYDKNILNVGAEVKAMEKVFSNVLPIFVNNVKELNDITSHLRIVASSKKTVKK